MERMRIGQDRHLVLDFLADEMERIWSSFDRARDKEPEVTSEMSEILAAKLPLHASEILSVLRSQWTSLIPLSLNPDPDFWPILDLAVLKWER